MEVIFLFLIIFRKGGLIGIFFRKGDIDKIIIINIK